MKNQFTTCEIAHALKELGFDEPCIAKYCKYNTNDQIELFPQNQNFFKCYFEQCKNSDYENEDKVAAPLWQQVIDWFREKHILIDISTLGDWHSWVFCIYTIKAYTDCFLIDQASQSYSTYEEARESAIIEAIKILKGESK